MLRGILFAPGIVIFAFALFHLSLRRPDGCLMPLAWTLMVGGVSLTLFGLAQGTRWRRFAGYLALALIGQGCALAMIHAPNYGVLQHYLPWQTILPLPQGLLLAGPVIQSILVLAAALRSWRRVTAGVKNLLSLPQAIALVAIMAFVSANLSRDPLQYLAEMVVAAWIGAVNIANLILVTAAVPANTLRAFTLWLQHRFTPSSSMDGAVRCFHRYLPWFVAFWATSVSAILAWAVFERIPHIPDSVAFLFQAKYFATGQLYLPAPPVTNAFDILYVINDGTKWYGYGFPGWPAVLALGVLAGVPWLVNPTIAGLTIILAHALLSRLYDRGFAHVAVLLLATSPWFLFMSASFMTHPITLVWSLIAFLAIEKARQKNPGRWGAIAGASLGALFLTRPLEGIIIAAVLGAWTLGTWKSPRALRTLGAGGVAAILVGGLSLPYNAMTTGKVTYFPMARYFDDHWYSGANRLGFGPDIGNVGWEHIDPFPGHGILDVIVNTHQNLYLLNFESFGWSFGSIPFVLLLLLWRQWNRADWLSLIIVLATITGNSFYFFSGAPDFGARYWYQVLIPLGVLTVRGIQELQRRCASTEQTPLAGPRVGAFVVLASLVALINFLPWRSLGKYNHYRGVRSDIMRLAQEYNFGHSLVFVREEDKSDYPSTFIFNPPNLNSTGTIYVRDIGPAGRAAVAQNFPDRPHWIVAGSSVLGGPFTLVSGPLPALAAQAR